MRIGAPAEGVLDELVGDTRAAILRALEIPMTTTEVASRLGVTPGAVSQQLAMLRRAGVVDAHRSGRGVYSELTPLGTSLLALLDA
jgi:DNA-binding transcriptional ArsR family regulator